MSPSCLAGRRTGKWVALVNRGSSQPFGAFTQTISVFFYNRKGRTAPAIRSGPSLSPTLWQVATHAPKGPRAHTMSPPSQGSKLVGRIIPQPLRNGKLARVRLCDLKPIFRPLGLHKPRGGPSAVIHFDDNNAGHQNGVHWCPFVSHVSGRSLRL